MNRLVTVSLFCGCGGADLGAKVAGADIILANDNDTDALATYHKYQNLLANRSVEVRCGDVAKIESFPPCDLVLGCYPCQSFTMGGPRQPGADPASRLFLHFRRCLVSSNPKFFVTENVAGLAWLNEGRYLIEQVECFQEAGKGYNISCDLLNAKMYGIPQERRRIFMVGIRKDLALHYWFPNPTHGPPGSGLIPWASHGDAITQIPVDAEGEYYDYPKEPFSWWYLSRNRKRRWEEPSYTIQANWRHVPLHPASPTMRLVESNLQDGYKQRWEFTGKYDHLEGHSERPKLARPRRLSWKECAAIQTFPTEFEPCGSVASKYRQIGNAVPPLLMEIIVRGIIDGTALRPEPFTSRTSCLAKL